MDATTSIRRMLLAAAGAAALISLLLAFGSPAAASAKNGKVLILETTVSGGASSREAAAAEENGEGVKLVSPAEWEAMSTAQFAEYDAIVIGDPTCGESPAPIEAASATAATWNAAIDGNIIVLGTDPVYHAGSQPGAAELIRRGMAFALERKGRTGGYLELSCYYHAAGAGTSVPMLAHLSPFGEFKVYGQFLFSSCPNESHIVATSPALVGITDAGLSNWSCSAHEAFEEWPADFQPLVINKDIGTTYTASDGTTGGPFIMARGATVISNISLTPATAQSVIGTTHTVTATVSEEGKPVAGTTVTFTVIAGPNKGITGTAVTDGEGRATFGYSSSVLGADLLHATYVDARERTETSNTVESTWVAPTPAPTPTPTPTPAPTPKTEVLAFGSAVLSSRRACVASSGYVATVTGSEIAKVTYSLNGHVVGTLGKPNNGHAYSLRIHVKAGKASRLSIKVTFTAGARPASVTLNRTLARCAAVKRVVKPRFTG